MKKIAIIALSWVVFFGSPVSILDWWEYEYADFEECAMALPPNHEAISREFETFMRRSPGYEHYIVFDGKSPDPKKGWRPIGFLWKSYRVYVRRAA